MLRYSPNNDIIAQQDKQHQWMNTQKDVRTTMKGASLLDVTEFHKYDTQFVQDSKASKSKKVARSTKGHPIVQGDDDVWVEKIYHTKNDNREVSVFVSKKTGTMLRDEPPTGMSKLKLMMLLVFSYILLYHSHIINLSKKIYLQGLVELSF